MASVYKPRYVMSIPAGATRCMVKGVPSVRYTDGKGKVHTWPVHFDRGGHETGKMLCEQNVWWMKYKLPDATTRREKGYRDKLATEQEAGRREREAQQAAAGVLLVDSKVLSNPIQTHIDEYRDSLERQGKAPRYYDLVHARVTRCAKECGWLTLRQIAPADMERFLAALNAEGLAPKTVNEFLGATKSFIRWCIRTRRLAGNSLEGLENTENPKDAENDKAALMLEQAKRLLDVAGPRRLLYFVALRTGLRRGELQELRWGDLHLDDLRPHIVLRAATTKAKRADTVPLREDVARELRAARPVGASPMDRVFEDVPRMRAMWKDFQNAGIPEKDELGKIYCFHSLRVTFGTWLAQAGTAPRVHMELLRHTDIKLTMRYYTDPRLLDTAHAVEGLPDLGSGQAGEGRGALGRTGTDDVEAPAASTIALNRAAERREGSFSGGKGASDPKGNRVGASANAVSTCLVARATGLEPATFGSTIRCSNQIELRPREGFDRRATSWVQASDSQENTGARAADRQCIFSAGAALSSTNATKHPARDAVPAVRALRLPGAHVPPRAGLPAGM